MPAPDPGRLLYSRSPWAYLLDLLAAFALLSLALPVLGGGLFPLFHAAARLGLETPLPPADAAKPFEVWEIPVSLVGLAFGVGVLLRYGGGYLLGLLLPAVQVEARVERLEVIRGGKGPAYFVTIGGVRSDSNRRLNGALREGQQVRVKRLRGSREILRVWEPG